MEIERQETAKRSPYSRFLIAPVMARPATSILWTLGMYIVVCGEGIGLGVRCVRGICVLMEEEERHVCTPLYTRCRGDL
jgi:hypothetical protein